MSLMLPKPQRLESPPYLRFIRDHRCCVPKCWHRPQAHHIVFDGQGRTGSKVSDYFAVPCCEKHHSEYHALVSVLHLRALGGLMNLATYSAECIGPTKFCSQCTYEDCACRCHLIATLESVEEPGPCDWECGCGSGRLIHNCCGYD